MKKWTPGEADEAWKVMICAREANRADQLLADLVMILTDAGFENAEGVALIRRMSGDQIVDAIIQYQGSQHQAVRNGLPGVTGKAAA